MESKFNIVAHAEFHLTSGSPHTESFRKHMWQCLERLTVKQIRMLVNRDGSLTFRAANYYNNCCRTYNGN